MSCNSRTENTSAFWFNRKAHPRPLQSFAGRPIRRARVELYFASGGRKAAVMALLDAHSGSPDAHVDVAVANVMVEIAGLSHIHDLDMIQATYNRLDAELQDIAGYSRIISRGFS